MFELVLKMLLAYLLGSIMGALWVGRFLGHVDIRTMGSGNAGGTNALRTQGWLFASLVVVVDVGKGMLAAGWLPGLDLPGLSGRSSLGTGWLRVLCGCAAVIGHVYPLYHGFRGGKGAATMTGALALISWSAVAVMALVWLACATLTGYVGLATMLATTAVAAYSAVAYGFVSPQFAFGCVMAAFIIFTHRANIARMLSGSENRMTRLMLFKPADHGASGHD